MLPYEILVGLRKTMCTCTHCFIGKQKSLRLISPGTRKMLSSSVEVPSSLSGLRIPFRDVNTNNIRRFHTQLLANCQSSIKNTKPIEESDNIPVAMDDSMNDLFSAVVKNKSLRRKDIESNHEPKQSNKTNSTMHNIPESVKNWLFSAAEKAPIKDLEKKFPEPKTYLHNMYIIVANETKIPQVLSTHTKHVNLQTKKCWEHTLTVKWPQEISFTSVSHSKAAASLSCCLKCLYWLDLNNRIKNRLPVVYDKLDTASIINAPEEFSVNPNILNKINDFLDKHEKNIQEILTNTEITETNKVEMATHSSQNPISQIEVDKNNRNLDLQQRLEKRKNITSPDLPIFQFRSQILKELENNQAVVIKGDTGCGKTTQVPQFIIDHMSKIGQGADCRMIVTQPRRISAISLAQRIAFERGENVGDVVGYQVRLQQNLPKQDGAILFCTTGLLLKKLQSNLGLEGCSHIIIDEAHERSVDTDMLLVLIRRAMQRNASLKVVVMSATINADLFQEYLGCNAVEVPGRLFPVKMNFLNDILSLGIPAINNNQSERQVKDDEDELPVVNCLEIAHLIRWICKHKPEGAILCFLPGWNHIQQVQNYIEEFPEKNVIVIPLHSKIPYTTQNQIFIPAPKDTRKIILATDIAETGITVPDVVYVIDSACHKEMIWHEGKSICSIDTRWVSKANIDQRKGRAGRVQEGESYHFISKSQYDSLEPYPIPEVLRVSLEKTVLDCKTYSNEAAVDFLGSMPQPPRLSAVKQAVSSLQTLGALDEDENLTALGKRIALFTIHPKLSKAMVYASIFQCLSPVTTISTALSMDSEIFYGTLDNKRRIRNSKINFHPSSDHLAIAWLYSQWSNILNKGWQQARVFCRQNCLHSERMMILHKVRDINLGHLQESGLIKDIFFASDLDSPENTYSVLDELVRGILLAGMDQILKYRNFEIKKGRFTKAGSSMVTEDNAKAQLTPESVNYKRTSWPSPYLIYYQKTHHNERRTSLIRESSMLSPVSLVLFSQEEISGTMYEDDNNNEEKVLLKIRGKTNVNLLCNEETARCLLRFRDTIWLMVQYYIENNVNSYGKPDEMEKYKRQLLNLLANLLSSASEFIDTNSFNDDSESDE